jgi:hypothetical protein
LNDQRQQLINRQAKTSRTLMELSPLDLVRRTLVRSLITGEVSPVYTLCEMFSDEAPMNMRINGRWLLACGRIPYYLLCAFLCSFSVAESPKWVQQGNSRIPNLDDAIMMNEAYLQSRTPEENKDGYWESGRGY